ncbi:MAG: ribonuclease H-like domain-containing protein, partial [Candidatus Levyibacteriota bacterium]
HMELFDQFSFYGAFRPKGFNLHMFTRAFGIESPKASGVDGDDVTALFKEKKYLEIAKYNGLDIVATKKLFDFWNSYIRM